jgi:hypothetical protein
MDNTRYIQSKAKAKTLSNRSHLTNGPLCNNYLKATNNRNMLRIGVIITITLVLVYSTLASSYAFAAGPDPHDICKKGGSCSCGNDPEGLTARCCQGLKCMTCDIDTTTGDFKNCSTYTEPSGQPPTSSPNDNTGFPKNGVAQQPQTSPKVPFNKGGVLAQ